MCSPLCDFFIASKEEAEIQCENAEKIIVVIKDYLREKFGI